MCKLGHCNGLKGGKACSDGLAAPLHSMRSHNCLVQDIAQFLWGFACLDHRPGSDCEQALLAAAEQRMPDLNDVM
eukprot:scaffold125652_cov23-Prasinocladus_malaysianus.AAC.1